MVTDLIAATVVIAEIAAIVATAAAPRRDRDRDFTPRDVPSRVEVPELDAAAGDGRR